MSRSLFAIPALLVAALSLGSCGYNADKCRLNPELCYGYPGGFCEEELDCRPGTTCCTTDNCGGGMCTVECEDDRDCPIGMLCEHDVCFYTCESDRDCAEGMSCEHGNTICEWD